MRSRIDVSEIEATTKIRAKYLRALENEEWGLLPGPTFVKSFLRTYAQALGLDGKALVEEYRQSEEGSSEAPHEPIVGGAGGRPRRDRGGPSRGYLTVVGLVGAVIVVLIVLLLTGGGGSGAKHPASKPGTLAGRRARSKRPAARSGALAGFVSLQLRPTAVVYVCLIGDGGRVLIPGLELPPGESTRVYRARRFEITLGNSDVSLLIDGVAHVVPPSSEAIGYSITKAYGRRALPAGSLPTCT